MFKIINTNVSIITAELTAIFEAMCYAINVVGRNIVIYTDSKSAILHIIRCVKGYRGISVSYKILNIINNLQLRGIALRLQWVPSHIGLTGNEKADGLAKTALSDGTDIEIKPNYTEVLGKYKEECYKLWKVHFDERSKSKGIWYKSVQCEPPRVPWFGNVRLTRQQVVMALRLRSGHVPLNKFGYLMKKVNSPKCDICDVDEDTQHFLSECVRNAEKRQEILDKFYINIKDVGIYQSILAAPESEAARILFEFKLR